MAQLVLKPTNPEVLAVIWGAREHPVPFTANIDVAAWEDGTYITEADIFDANGDWVDGYGHVSHGIVDALREVVTAGIDAREMAHAFFPRG